MKEEPKKPNPFLTPSSPAPTEASAGPTVPTDSSLENASSAPAPSATPVNAASQMDSLLNGNGAQVPMSSESAPKKKNKLPLIISLAVITVLLIGGAVFGVLYAIERQKPENVVLGAITNAIKSKAVKVTGNFTLSGDVIESTGIKSVTIGTSGESSVLPSSSETSIKIIAADDNTYEIKTSEIFLESGALYFEVEGLIDVLDGYVDLSLADLTDEQAEAAREMIEDQLGSITGLLEEIDGQWWRFDISDFDLPEQYTDLYSKCFIGMTIGSLSTSHTKDELSQLYKDWPLFDVTETDQKLGDAKGYEVSFNLKNVAGFGNNLKGTGYYQGITKCIKAQGTDYDDFDDINASDLSLPGNTPTITIFAHPWSHELSSIRVTHEPAEGHTEPAFTGSLNLEFVDFVSISAPESAKSAKELADTVITILCEFSGYEDTEDCPYTNFLNGGSSESAADIQRKDDLALLLTAVASYQSNNRGALPTQAGWNGFISDYITDVNDTGIGSGPFADPTTGQDYAFVFGALTTRVGQISVNFQSACDDDTAVSSTSAQDIALITFLGSGSTFCMDNQ